VADQNDALRRPVPQGPPQEQLGYLDPMVLEQQEVQAPKPTNLHADGKVHHLTRLPGGEEVCLACGGVPFPCAVAAESLRAAPENQPRHAAADLTD
jgi:hypothetical protein